MVNLILDLSDLTLLPHFTYITRHTNDKIPKDQLEPFLHKYSQFVENIGKDQPYNLPTVWFVGHFENYDMVSEIKDKIDAKNISYFESGGEYGSFEEINDSYWDYKRDAHLFPKFLHQVTMIGIDILSVPESIITLKQFECLEWLQYSSAERLQSDLYAMEQYLSDISEYYSNSIKAEENEYNEFWENFKKVKRKDLDNGKTQLGSWPHFLFNICGVHFSPKICE